MNKELFIAIIVGLSFGLVIAQGIRISKEALKKAETNYRATQNNPNISQITPINPYHQLVLTSPPINSLLDAGNIKLTGVTTKNSLLMVTESSKVLATVADTDGTFHFDINLSKGPHQLELTSIDPETSAIATISSMLVINPISSESGSKAATPNPSPKPTPTLAIKTKPSPSPSSSPDSNSNNDSPQNITDTIKKRLESTLTKTNSSQVLVANISKITTNSITLVDQEGNPKLASISAQTRLLSLDGKKTFKPEDLAVDSPVIIIYEPIDADAVIPISDLFLLPSLPDKSPLKISAGRIQSIDIKNDRFVINQNGKDLNVLLHKKTEYQLDKNRGSVNLKNLTINQFVSVVYDPSESDDTGPRVNLIFASSIPTTYSGLSIPAETSKPTPLPPSPSPSAKPKLKK